MRAARGSGWSPSERCWTARRCHSTTTATTLRPRAGQPLITDGPFAEAREQLGGYTLIEAANIDEAIAIAAGFMTDSTLASIEVRPVVDFSLETMEARA